MTEIHNVSFGAKYVDNIKVKKYHKWINSYLPQKSCLVQIDFGNNNDLEAIREVCDTWRWSPFLRFMQNAGKAEKVFALTLQKKKFENLEPEKLLGFAKIREYAEKDGNIEFLQVNPKYINVGEERISRPKYKGNGTAILKLLQKKYEHLSLLSVDEPGIDDFYRSNGFILEDGWIGLFNWDKPRKISQESLTDVFLKYIRNLFDIKKNGI
ncbi:hypothetical protein IKQ21_08300 [bacterium]|nr:hypothetical protein [bacterium]